MTHHDKPESKAWRISKYAPTRRDSAGRYPADEWTAYSDIGKAFAGVTLTREEYLRVEDQYLAAIVEIATVAGQTALRVQGLELSERSRPFLSIPTIENEMSVEGESLIGVLRDGLREHLWCRLEGDGFSVDFGYDYYVHVCTRLGKSDITRIVVRHNLYAEPYRRGS